MAPMPDPEAQPRSSRLRAFYSEHRGLVLLTGIVLAALAIFVLVWFQPQKLFIEKEVNEALPGTSPAPPAPETTSDPEAPSETVSTVASGSFRGLEHATSGTASLVQTPDGKTYLRFEDLETSNGPDLRVYLSEIAASDDWYAYGERFVDLGPLKGNLGNQNYEVPEDLDLSRFRSAVIWCRRFTVGFGVAPLDA